MDVAWAVAVEDEHLGVALQGAQHHLLELAAAEHEARVDVVAHLGDGVDHFHARGAGQLAQLAEGVLHLPRALLVRHMHEHGAAVLGHHGPGRAHPGKLVFQGADGGAKVDVEPVKGNGSLGAPGLAIGVFGQEVRPVDVAGGAVGAGVNGRDEVKAKAREVDEVVVGEGLAA